MYNPEELRPANIIMPNKLGSKKTIGVILSREPNGFKVKQADEVIMLKVGEIEPIPLNERWALFYEFIEEPGVIEPLIKKFSKKLPEIGGKSMKIWIYINEKEDNYVFCITNSVEKPKYYHYVHQLQNLYKDLTNTELSTNRIWTFS